MTACRLERRPACSARCRKHASAPSSSRPVHRSRPTRLFAQVSVGESGFFATTWRQGHPLFGTRYYDPTVGRWTQQDALAGAMGSPGTQNRYAYVGNDPINFVDPSGKVLDDIVEGIGAGFEIADIAEDPFDGDGSARDLMDNVAVAGAGLVVGSACAFRFAGVATGGVAGAVGAGACAGLTAGASELAADAVGEG